MALLIKSAAHRRIMGVRKIHMKKVRDYYSLIEDIVNITEEFFHCEGKFSPGFDRVEFKPPALNEYTICIEYNDIDEFRVDITILSERHPHNEGVILVINIPYNGYRGYGIDKKYTTCPGGLDPVTSIYKDKITRIVNKKYRKNVDIT